MDNHAVTIDMDNVFLEPPPPPPTKPARPRPRPRPYRRAQSAFLPGVEPGGQLNGDLTSRPTSVPNGLGQLDEYPRPIFTVDHEIKTQPGGFKTQSQKSQTTTQRNTSSPFSPASYPIHKQQASLQRNNTRANNRPPFPNSQMFLSEPTISTRVCNCQCQCDNARNRPNGNILPQPDMTGKALSEEMTSEDLSWRRLHMSRAKLKATATTSELLAGFAMVAMVELQINAGTNVPEWLFVLFSVCTTVLVAVHIFALMISTYLLPNIDAVSKLHVRGVVSESPHERMRGFIELAWAFSTVLGLFLFLVEVAILCWVKFWDYSFTAAWAATIIVVPVLVVFVAFAVHFYHTLVVYKVRSATTDMKELEEMRMKLEAVNSEV